MWFSRSTEPRYMGKTLGEWIDTAQPTLVTNSNGQTEQYFSLHNQKELQGALRAMGSNAIPTLVAILDETDSVVVGAKSKALKTPYIGQSLKAKFTGDLQAAHNKLGLIAQTFRLLGDNALHAIGDLERIACAPNRTVASTYAISALGLLEFGGVPALQRCLTNSPSDRHFDIQLSLNLRYRADLKSVRAEARTAAALALATAPNPPFEIIYPLTEILENSDPQNRRRALDGLARHLPNLAPSLVVAYRAVEKQITSDDPEIRRVATELLAKLNSPPPEKKP
jgi:hypothetical protein